MNTNVIKKMSKALALLFILAILLCQHTITFAKTYEDSGLVSLLEFEGLNGSTDIIDSVGGTMWTNMDGKLQISTERSKCGNSSLKIDGASDGYLTAYLINDWSKDFTIEWDEFIPSSNTDFSRFVFECSQGNDFGISYGCNPTNYCLGTRYKGTRIDGAPSGTVDGRATFGRGPLITDKWVHKVLVKKGYTISVYNDGILNRTTTFEIPMYYNAAMPFALGRRYSTSNSGCMYIDQLKILNYASYDAGQAVSAPSANSNPLSLLEFEGENGSTDIVDSIPGRIWSNMGSKLHITTEKSRYGNSCLKIEGASDGYITTPCMKNWSEDFTIEWDEYIPSSNTDFSRFVFECSQGNDFGISYGCNPTNYCLGTRYKGSRIDGISSGNIDGRATFGRGPLTMDKWVHKVLVKKGYTISVYNDGILNRTTTFEIPMYYNAAMPFALGRRYSTSNSGFMYIDQFKIFGYAAYNPFAPTIPLPQPTNNPPKFNAIDDKMVNENEPLEFSISATDDSGDVLTYSPGNLPAGATFDPVTKTFNWTPDYSQYGSYTVTFTVSDGSLTTSEDVEITVNSVNRSPVLSKVENKTIDEGNLLQFIALGSDPDGDALTYTATGLPSGASFDQATQTFSWMPDYSQSGNYTVTFTVSDGNLIISEEVIITVIDIPTTAMISKLINQIITSNLPIGTQNLSNALASLQRGNTIAAKNQLQAFINQVNAQTGKQLTINQATELIGKVQTIINNIK